MSESLHFLRELADAEFDGDCFNGPAFMKTLDGLVPEVAAWSDTYEGYSAWELALHCAYYKYFLAKSLGAAEAIEPYPFDKGKYGFGKPSAVDAESWSALLAYLRKAHRVVWDAACALPEAGLEEIMPEWKIPRGRALAWLATHDTFHGAQLRSMGVPGLKEPKEG